MTYPIGFDLAGRTVLVVGGGPVATRRVPRLLEAGARVVVVAPAVTAELHGLAESGELVRKARGFRDSDLDEVWLVLAHTDSAEVQDRVAAAAEARRVLCVKGGDPDGGSARVPAVASAHGVDVAVSAGRDPRRARAVAAWAAAGIETATAPVRPQGGRAEGTDRQEPGTVALVGGGPGDPGLLTVRGRWLLAGADVVVADRLGPTSLLPQLAEHAEIVDVGKRAGYHKLTQDRINETLVARAREGLRVVRLKGGDPFVFGRGGEEAEYCRAHGVPVEVVPGITSAISVPAAAGIPVTHRELTRGFTVVTAHEELVAVPHSPEHTILLLMGVRRLAASMRPLIEAGHAPDTPVAVVESGWTPRQRVTRGTLATIADLAVERGVRAPAVTVVGRVAALAVTDPVEPGDVAEDDSPAQDPSQGSGPVV